jgi:MipA family protein
MNQRWATAAATVLAVCFLFLPVAAAGQEIEPAWELGLGVGLLHLPDYRGSNESRFYALPYPYIIYRGDVLEVDRQTIYGRIFGTDRVLLDVSYYGSVPVDSSKNAARAGMEDLDPTFEIGPALDIALFNDHKVQRRFRLLLPVRPVFSTDLSSIRFEGWVASPRLIFEDEDFIAGTGVLLSISAGPIFAGRGYHDYYYTVDPAYATPERPAYKAGGGYSGSSLTFSLRKEFPHFNLTGFVSADFLEGAVIEDSPLVKTKTTFMSGISISWVFYKSGKKVVD